MSSMDLGEQFVGDFKYEIKGNNLERDFKHGFRGNNLWVITSMNSGVMICGRFKAQFQGE